MVSLFSNDTGLNADEPQGAESCMEAGDRHRVALPIPQSSISQAIDNMLDGIRRGTRGTIRRAVRLQL